jgi:hypothetical protein
MQRTPFTYIIIISVIYTLHKLCIQIKHKAYLHIHYPHIVYSKTKQSIPVLTYPLPTHCIFKNQTKHAGTHISITHTLYIQIQHKAYSHIYYPHTTVHIQIQRKAYSHIHYPHTAYSTPHTVYSNNAPSILTYSLPNIQIQHKAYSHIHYPHTVCIFKYSTKPTHISITHKLYCIFK